MLSCGVIGGGYPTSNRSQGVATTKCACGQTFVHTDTHNVMFWCGVHTNQDPPNHIQLTKEGAWSGCSMVWIYGVEWCVTACNETAREHIIRFDCTSSSLHSIIPTFFLPASPSLFLLFSSLFLLFPGVECMRKLSTRRK